MSNSTREEVMEGQQRNVNEKRGDHLQAHRMLTSNVLPV
jgi:hypothetical protein